MIRSREITVAFTGYRPEKIRLSNSSPNIEGEIRRALSVVITDLYARGYRTFLSGMAEGFDLWAADEVLQLKESGRCEYIRLVAVVPFRGQARRFSPEFTEIYEKALRESDEVIVLSDHYYKECYAARNDYLVDNSSMVVCYFDGQPGGTRYTVSRARKAGLPLMNLCEPSLLF